MAADIEAELKFELTPADIDRLKASAGDIKGFAVGKRRVAKLVSTYFDSEDHRLRSAGISLRIRTEGKRREQTIKLSGAAGAGLRARPELTIAGAGENPDLSALGDPLVAEALAAALDGAALGPIFSAEVTRTRRKVVTPEGDEVEYALDECVFTAGDRSEAFHEAEFELKSGDRRAVFAVAREVMAPVPVRLSAMAKSERGYRLADGATAAAASPVKALEPEIAGGDAVEEALCLVLRSCFDQITGNVSATLESADPEGPHQLRVGLRRLRTALSLFKSVIDADAAAGLRGEVHWLAGEVGKLRDLDVLADEIVAPCAVHVDVQGLVGILEARRRAVRDDVVTLLAGPRVGALLIDLAGFIEIKGWRGATDPDQAAALAKPAYGFVERAVRKGWRKVARLATDVDALSGEDRHTLRKAFKRLRYTLDFCASMLPAKERRRLLRDVRAAQDVLGYLNDVRMAQQLGELVSCFKGFTSRAQYGAAERAAGFCLGWHEARAERSWEEAKGLVALDRKAV